MASLKVSLFTILRNLSSAMGLSPSNISNLISFLISLFLSYFFWSNLLDIRRVAAIGTQLNDTSKVPADSDSPFVNADDDDEDDGYIDDNPLDDLDQFTLKIDMDGGFIVYDPTICDPILSKPISSWIDDVTSEVNDSDTDGRDGRQGLTSSSPPSQKATTTKTKESTERTGKDIPDMESYIFSNSSLTTSGVSTLSSLDCRLVGEDVQVASVQRSFSADNLDKFSKPRECWDLSLMEGGECWSSHA